MTFDPTSVEVTCVTVPKDHCVQVPWEYVNVCGYSYQFCKNYHIHTYTYYVHTTYILHTTYYVQNQWSHSLFLNYVQARQKLFAISLHLKKKLIWKATETHSIKLNLKLSKTCSKTENFKSYTLVKIHFDIIYYTRLRSGRKWFFWHIW